jgi:hypothetical protein
VGSSSSPPPPHAHARPRPRRRPCRCPYPRHERTHQHIRLWQAIKTDQERLRASFPATAGKAPTPRMICFSR